MKECIDCKAELEDPEACLRTYGQNTKCPRCGKTLTEKKVSKTKRLS